MKIISTFCALLFVVLSYNKMYSNQYFDWTITIPEGNWFYQQNVKDIPAFGFLGLSTSFDWFYISNENLSLKLSAVTTYNIPIPVIAEPIWAFDTNYTGPGDSYSSALIIGLSRNHSILLLNSRSILELGYGVSYVSKLFFRDQWIDGRIDSSSSFRLNTQEIDLNLSLRLKLFGFYVGLNYLPSIIQLSPSLCIQYNHVFYIDIGGVIGA